MSQTSNEQAQQGTSVTGGLKERAEEVAHSLRDAGANLKEAAAERYQEAKEKASEYYQSGKEKAEQWQHQIRGFVREQPLKSLMIAAGVGLVLGVVWKRI